MNKEEFKTLSKSLETQVGNIFLSYKGRRESARKDGKNPDEVGLGEFSSITVGSYLILRESEALNRLTKVLIGLTIILSLVTIVQLKLLWH